jgi:leader peptidase (prepilin peptidase)/N-methyltransferase
MAFFDVLPPTFMRAAAFAVGASFGSFLNVCVGRWPRQLSVVRPRSRCSGCGREIAWYDNIPIASWLALRGKCRACGTPISGVYPLVELVVALGWLAAVMQFGVTLTAVRVAVFGTILLGVMLTDAATFTIPDGFTLFGLVWAVLLAVIAFLRDDLSPFAGPVDAVLGACVGAGAIAIAGWLGEVILKREAMGFGDVTLMAMVGAHLGPGRTLLTVPLGAAIGLAFILPAVLPGYVASRVRGEAYQSPEIPFGVFLAPGAMIALLWGAAVIRWVLGQ